MKPKFHPITQQRNLLGANCAFSNLRYYLKNQFIFIFNKQVTLYPFHFEICNARIDLMSQMAFFLQVRILIFYLHNEKYFVNWSTLNHKISSCTKCFYRQQLLGRKNVYIYWSKAERKFLHRLKIYISQKENPYGKNISLHSKDQHLLLSDLPLQRIKLQETGKYIITSCQTACLC